MNSEWIMAWQKNLEKKNYRSTSIKIIIKRGLVCVYYIEIGMWCYLYRAHAAVTTKNYVVRFLGIIMLLIVT